MPRGAATAIIHRLDFELSHTSLLLDCCDHHLPGPGPTQPTPRGCHVVLHSHIGWILN
jgi:hypothetical protein